MKPSIEKLDAGLREIIESKGRSSKAKIIRGLFNRITEAMEEGITLDMLVDYLHQNDIAITKNSLRNTLYRIRKERDGNLKTKTDVDVSESPTFKQAPIISKNEVPPSENSTKESTVEELEGEERLQDILDRFYSVNGLKDRYKVLGGDINDFKGKSISDQRQLVNNLKIKVTRQLSL
ncbi:hypothetical protein [Vibrio rotiferianus]|uniref:hypothetical protein n=1 Tax=Vibrio rotiferianus TaxID=190895 RepID=UPI0005EDB43C|nr:hypothetical protein [Vibrio rotiferianus]